MFPAVVVPEINIGISANCLYKFENALNSKNINLWTLY